MKTHRSRDVAVNKAFETIITVSVCIATDVAHKFLLNYYTHWRAMLAIRYLCFISITQHEKLVSLALLCELRWFTTFTH